METQEVKLTEEMRSKLRGTIGFDVSAEFPYVPLAFRDVKNEIPKELWPIFTLKSKDGIQIAEAEDNAGEMIYDDRKKETKMQMKSGSQRLKTLESGIRKVKSYPLEDGRLINFDLSRREIIIVDTQGRTDTTKGVTVRDLIKFIPVDLQVELQNTINERKTLTEEELRGLEY